MTAKKKKLDSQSWLPKRYKRANLLQRAVIYLAVHPGLYLTEAQLVKLVSTRWPAVAKYLHRMASIGLIDLQAGYVEGPKWNNDPLAKTGTLSVPAHMEDLPETPPVMLYGATRQLIALVESGKFKQLVSKRPRPPMASSISTRVIEFLASKHPRMYLLPILKAEAYISEPLPALLYRLEQLEAVGLVEIIDPRVAYVTSDRRYDYANLFRVLLGTSGWLKLQQARNDKVSLVFPKIRHWDPAKTREEAVQAKAEQDLASKLAGR